MNLFGLEIKIIPFARKEFLILDNLHFSYIKNIFNLLSPIEYEVVDTRYESFCLFSLFSLKFYKVLLKTKKVKLAYFAGIIDFVKPKKAITFNDNNKYFYKLSLIFNKTEFFAIQNSNHFLCSDKNKNDPKRYKTFFLNIGEKYFPVSYFSIGEYESFAYKQKCSFKFKEIIPVGSLATANRFYSKGSTSIPLNPKYDLGIIGNSNYCLKLGVDDSLMLSYIRELINLQDKLKVCYISKFEIGSEKSIEEKFYIKNFFNGKLKYKAREKNIDSLDRCINCKIIMGTNTAILREAFSIGVKIMSLNTLPFSHSTVYDYVSFKKFPEFVDFENEINNLLKISRKEYFKKFDFKLLDLNTLNGNTAIENIAREINKRR
tara:strand:+ start:950 stop:2074 length:1125 start_codon:yes stop_codon:yes gene_type:complete